MEAERGQINLLKATEHFNIKVNGYLISLEILFSSWKIKQQQVGLHENEKDYLYVRNTVISTSQGKNLWNGPVQDSYLQENHRVPLSCSSGHGYHGRGGGCRKKQNEVGKHYRIYFF